MTKTEVVVKVAEEIKRVQDSGGEGARCGDWFHHPGHTRRRQGELSRIRHILRCQKGGENREKPPDRQGNQDSGKEGSQVLRGNGLESGSRRQAGSEASGKSEKEVIRNIGRALRDHLAYPHYTCAPIEVPNRYAQSMPRKSMFAAIADPTTHRMEDETAKIAFKRPHGSSPKKNATILAGTMITPAAVAPSPTLSDRGAKTS